MACVGGVCQHLVGVCQCHIGMFDIMYSSFLIVRKKILRKMCVKCTSVSVVLH